MMSLYGKYIQERLGKFIVEEEWGFATFSIGPTGCYLEDIFVDALFRGENRSFELADRVAEEAKAKGCKILWGSVVPSAKGATISMNVLLSYGFEVDSATDNFVVLRKEI